MASETEYLKLKKPSPEDFYDVNVHNDNMDLIDAKSKQQNLDTTRLSDTINEHISNKNNPHSVTKSHVGLDQVDNTSDANKPVSALQAEAISLAQAQTESVLGGYISGEIAKQQNNLNTHESNKSNPHGVTAAQVGLDKVPNVATNDQTPTYTEASTLATLTSGEKLSVAFGKIKKAITDFISHLADNAKHITTAERMKWNGIVTKENPTLLKTIDVSFPNIVHSSSTNNHYNVEITGVDFGAYDETIFVFDGTVGVNSKTTTAKYVYLVFTTDKITNYENATARIGSYYFYGTSHTAEFAVNGRMYMKPIEYASINASPSGTSTDTIYDGVGYGETDWGKDLFEGAKLYFTVASKSANDTTSTSSVTGTLKIYGRKGLR